MRPGYVQFGDFWFGNADQPIKGYKVKHPDIFEYSDKHVDPKLVRASLTGDYRGVVKEEAEQIYTFDLFTPEFCRKLIEEAEACGKWASNEDEGHGFRADKKTLLLHRKDKTGMTSRRDGMEPDTKQFLSSIPGDGEKGPGARDGDARLNPGKLNQVQCRTIQTHVVPLMEKLWKTFRPHKFDPPYLIKYEPKKIKGMGLHHDYETVAIIIYLNTEYAGGGTYFPRFNYDTNGRGKPKPGRAVMYPGGVAHEHLGRPITLGKRFLMLSAYY